jgi:molybdopterin/thiamine biosynthesis adenylyltransferase
MAEIFEGVIIVTSDRYSRQILFAPIGPEGQERLNNSYAVVIGCGALGTVIASGLVRAGVGKVRIVDRDFIEYHNLQRQILFDEDDIKDNLPKAVAAERRLRKINSSIEIEGIVSDVNHTNIERLVEGADVIVDGLDNFEARLLINDVSLKHNIPWIYGGAIGSTGMTMNIIPHKAACYRCLMPEKSTGARILTCDTAGVVNGTPWIIASLQTVEAIKILIGSQEVNRYLVTIDVWNGDFRRLDIPRRDNCLACSGEYEFLDGKLSTKTTSLCGQNAVQVLSSGSFNISLKELSDRLKPLGEVSYSNFMLQFSTGGQEMVVFPDGRAIVKNTHDEAYARGLYAKYVGT